MNTFLTSNDTQWRLARTIVQGVIGAIIAYADMLFGIMTIPNELRPFIVAVTMAVLAPIMSCIKTKGEVIEVYGGENDAMTDEEHEILEPDDASIDFDDSEEIDEAEVE